MKYRMIKNRSDIPKQIKAPMLESTIYFYCQHISIEYKKSLSINDIKKYHQKNAQCRHKTPINKLGHYFVIAFHPNNILYIIPYHVYFDLEPPKNIFGKIIKHKDTKPCIIDWHTIGWNYASDSDKIPPAHSTVWPEKRGKLHFTLFGFYMQFPSGLRFYMEDEFPSLRYNNALDADLPSHSSGQWIINSQGLWEIVFTNGERYIPMSLVIIKKDEKATIK